MFNKPTSEASLLNKGLMLSSSFRCDQIYMYKTYDFGHTLLCYLSRTQMFNKPTSVFLHLLLFTLVRFCFILFVSDQFWGLYCKTLRILNLQKNDKFRSKQASSCLDKHTSLDEQTCQLTTESVHYRSVMFYCTSPCLINSSCPGSIFTFRLGRFEAKKNNVWLTQTFSSKAEDLYQYFSN